MSNKTTTKSVATKPATSTALVKKTDEKKTSFWSKAGDAAKAGGTAVATVAATTTGAAAIGFGATLGVCGGIVVADRLFGKGSR